MLALFYVGLTLPTIKGLFSPAPVALLLTPVVFIRKSAIHAALCLGGEGSGQELVSQQKASYCVFRLKAHSLCVVHVCVCFHMANRT